MKTQVLNPSQIDIAADLLKQGELVAFPTETVYGLGAAFGNQDAIDKVFKAKGRPSDNPLIVHVSSLAQVEEIAQDVPEAFYQLVRALWPGPLTCILKKAAHIPSSMTAGLNSIAVRMPAHPLALALIEHVGTPLVAPSANLSGKPSPTRPQHVLDDLNHKIAAIIDGGPCQVGLESTVINLLTHSPCLLRPGIITQEELAAVLGIPILKSETNHTLSPGMRYRHYAPACPLFLISSEQEWKVKRSLPLDKKRLWLVSSPHLLITEHDALLTPQTLYALLRHADTEGYEEICAFCDDKICSNLALMNRLSKAVEPT